MAPVLAPLLAPLVALLRGRRIAVLSGAGCSTDSGIPDYRGLNGTLLRSPPIQYAAFVRSEATRRRYWARSTIGWPRFSRARPNAAHHAITALGRGGRLTGLITQNVDGLHRAAGTEDHIELHGRLDTVRCLGCQATAPRAELQERLLAHNPAFADLAAASPVADREGRLGAAVVDRPDGDVALEGPLVEGFQVPACAACGGVLKPDVVLFGENVARPVVEAAYALVDRAEALLVVGSSLTVFSGYRFALRAAERGVPLCLINQGATRADPLAALRVEAPLGQALPALAAALAE